MKRKSNKLVAGVGVNDADYPVVRFGKDINGKRNREWVCPFYKTWSAMLNRCYQKATNNEYSAYKDTTVCDDWHTFSNFKSWMERQDWEGKELDKDLLTDNNQYAPENCIFIPEWMNSLIAGEKKPSCYNLIAIYEDGGRYTSSPCCGNVVYSESFIDVKDAINHYHKVKKDYVLSLNLSKDSEHLLLEFFDRRKLRSLISIESFIEMFPVRPFEIRRSNIPNVGDKFKTFKGDWYTVLEVRSHEDILIKFEDGSTRSVRNNRIADGRISKPTIKDPFVKIKERVDKVFKWNSHGLISGVQYCNSGYIGVTYRSTERSACKYFKNLDDAISFRQECLLKRVESIIGIHSELKEEVLQYFNNRWNTEVVKYSGKLQPNS